MKNKLLIIAGSIIAVLFLLTLIAPQLILMADKQEEVAKEYAYSEVFFNEYDEVREHLLAKADALNADGITTELYSYALSEDDDLYIDTIYMPSTDKQTNLIVLTTGVHGIEGYIGSVMLDVFWEEIYPELDRENTGVLIVANVNPYGMKYHR